MTYEFKVGDEVFLVRWGLSGKSYEALTKVESISPKRGDLKVAGHEVIFYTTGRQKRVGGYTGGLSLELATNELKTEVRAKQKKRKDIVLIQDLDVKEMTEEGIEALANAIRALPEGSFKKAGG